MNLKASAYRNLKEIAIKRISNPDRGQVMYFVQHERNDLTSVWGRRNYEKFQKCYDRRARLSEELKEFRCRLIDYYRIYILSIGYRKKRKE